MYITLYLISCSVVWISLLIMNKHYLDQFCPMFHLSVQYIVYTQEIVLK